MPFLSEHGVEILLSLITAGALGFCRYMGKQMAHYRDLINDQHEEEISDLIDKKLEPINKEIQELREYLANKEKLDEYRLELLISSYKFRLVFLCKKYLHQGYMTQDQYDQLTEFFKLYSALGGNSQGEDYYHKTSKLPIRDLPSNDEEDI